MKLLGNRFSITAFGILITISCSMNIAAHREMKKLKIVREIETEVVFDLGTLQIGDQKELILQLENTLEVPVVINEIKRFCGCTIPTYDSKPIFPLKSSEVKIVFAAHQIGTFYKSLKMYLSSQEKPIKIVFSGKIEHKKS